MAQRERGFDVLGTAYDPAEDYVAALVQCFNDINMRPAPDNPGVERAVGRFMCKRQGDLVMIEYHLMELGLDDNRRCQDFVDECDKAVAEMAKELKKQFKSRTKVVLKLKEDKDKRNWAREKVSLNGQWYLRCWRVYSVSPEADQSERV